MTRQPILIQYCIFKWLTLTIFPICSIASRKSANNRSVDDSNRYKHLDGLKDILLSKKEYEIVELSDELSGITVYDMPDRNVRTKAKAAFVSGIGFNFSVVVFTYKRHGTLGNWTVVFCMGRGHT